MAHHELKTDPDCFQSSFDGIKNYEMRWDDRDFKAGDTLTLKETVYSYKDMINIKDPKPLLFTCRELTKTVNHVLHGNNYGLQPGWAILNLDV